MPEPNHAIAAAIFEQVKNEVEARKWYEEVLARYPELDDEDIAKIQEIQSDEANHMLVLMAMAKRYDGGISASADGLQQAISEIVIGIGAKDHSKKA